MLSEQEKLEEELRFLKESFNIGVITKEEFESGRQRIEARLNEFYQEGETEEKEHEKNESQLKLEEEKTEPTKEEEIKEPETKKEEKTEPIEEEPPEKKSITGEKPIEEPTKETLEKKESIEEEKTTEKEEIKIEPREEEKPEEEPKEKAEESKEEEKEPIVEDEEIKINKKTIIFAAVFIIAALGAWFFFFSGNSDVQVEVVVDESTAVLVSCYADDDCKMEGKIGTCENPGIQNAECTFADDVRIKVAILNSNECFNCNTGRILSILDSFFPNLETENIDFEDEGGIGLAEQYNLNSLPAYILNASVADAYNYEKFSNAFNEVNGNFVMKNTVANANYYIDREEVQNKLDLFVQQGQEASSKAEENLKEFLEAFDGKVDFEKHDSNDEVAKELGINTFPVFLINNKVKFSGVQSADKIRENFCQMNQLVECVLGFSESLI